MKPTLFIVGGSSTALEIRETVDQFFKDKYFAVYNVISDEEPPILQTYIRDSSLLDRLSTIEVSHYIIGFTNRTLRLRFVDLFGGFNSVLDNVIHPSSYISPSAILGKGNYLAANAVISSNALIGNSNFFNFFEYFLLMVIYIIESGFTEEGFWLDIGVLSHMYMTMKAERKAAIADLLKLK